MAKVMLTLKLRPGEASLGHVRRKLKLSPAEIDGDFGVVAIDPKQDVYAVMVDEEVAGAKAKQPEVDGPYSDPRIESFGPLERNRTARVRRR